MQALPYLCCCHEKKDAFVRQSAPAFNRMTDESFQVQIKVALKDFFFVIALVLKETGNVIVVYAN